MRRGPLIAFAAAPLAIVLIEAACSPFGAPAAGEADAAQDRGAADGGSAGSDAGSDAGSGSQLACATSTTTFAESFSDANFAARGWTLNQKIGGSFTIGDSLGGAKLSANFGVASASVTGGSLNNAASIVRDFATKPSAARLEFKLLVAALEPYAQFGCDLRLLKTATATEELRLLLTHGGNVTQVLATFNGETQEAAVTLPMRQAVDVVLELNSQFRAVAWVNGTATTLPALAGNFVPDGVRIVCGVPFLIASSSATAKATVGIDDVRLTICPGG